MGFLREIIYKWWIFHYRAWLLEGILNQSKSNISWKIHNWWKYHQRYRSTKYGLWVCVCVQKMRNCQVWPLKMAMFTGKKHDSLVEWGFPMVKNSSQDASHASNVDPWHQNKIGPSKKKCSKKPWGVLFDVLGISELLGTGIYQTHMRMGQNPVALWTPE